MSRKSAGFWVWPVGAAVGVAAALALDIAFIALGRVPAVPGLLSSFALPGIAGCCLGIGNRRASRVDLLLMALLMAGVLYGFMVFLSILGLALSSNVSCSEPQAPSNCDNDIGTGVGVGLGLPVAGLYGALAWLGSLAGVAIARPVFANRP